MPPFAELHHVCIVVADVAAGEAEVDRMGLPVLMRGRRPDGSGFTSFDTPPQAGVILEVRSSAPSPA